MIPIRERERGEASTRTSRYAVRIRLPSRTTFSISRRRVSRASGGNPKPSLRAGVLARQLDGEALASLLAPAAEYFASPFRLHTRAKAVSFDSALVPGTVRRLTHWSTPRTVERTLRDRLIRLVPADG